MLWVLAAAAALLLALPAASPAAPGDPPQISVDPGSYDFGLQPMHSGSQTTFQLRNDGAEQVQLESLEVGGPGAEAFWVNNCHWTWLQPGESCFAQVYFNPQGVGEFEAQLRVNSAGHQFTADLGGEGGRAILTPASNPVDFGTAAVESAGVVREIEVSNLGNMAGGVFIAVVSGGAVGSFQLLDENCTGIPLMPAATCTVQVRFRPLSEGAKKATLSLFGDSDDGAQIVLIGMGSAPEPEPEPAAWEPFEPHAQAQSHPAGSDSSVTTIVRKTTHRITRPRVRSQRRKQKRRGLRHHRRAGLAQASRLP
jgi:hypothetical protein